MKWTKEQEQAIYRNKSNILIAAAAGSGKTAVLVERIINKIINEKIDIDKLLVVTFTNAAASEMRERILNAIYKKIDESKSEEEQENLQRQVVLINKASICTIDSFCLDVIRNNFFEIDVSPNFRIGDTTEMELLKLEVLEDLFEEKYEKQDEDFQTLIRTYTSYRDDTPLKDLVLKIFSYISSSPYPKTWLENQIEKFNLKDKNIDFTQTIWGKILIEEIKEELIDDIAILQNEAKKLSVEKDLILFQKTIESDCYEFQKLLEHLDKWNEAYTIANSIDFITWPRTKTNLPQKDDAKKVRDSVKKKFRAKADKIFVSTSKETIQDITDMYETLVKLKNLIFEFEDRFSKKKKEGNILDFSDIEHLALQILVKETENGKHTRSDIAKKYQQKFEEIAIDEYQDSNLVQEYILTAVSRGNNIFMVGDVKQSIYKFRQAMPELFLEKYKTYSLDNPNEKGLKIQLFKNFRSRENILDFTNLIFEKIMSEDLGDIDYNENEYLNLGAIWDKSKENTEFEEEHEKQDNIPEGKTKKIKNEIDIIDLKEQENSYWQEEKIKNQETEEETDKTEEEVEERLENIEIEAKFVASKIKDLVDSKFQVYDLKKQQYRNIKYKDIVILLRSTKGKAPVFENELINKNIPVYSDMSAEYIDSIEVHTILSLLKIIDNPMQDVPLVTVMRSVIGDFTDNDLVEIRLADQYSDFYTALLKAKINVSEELRKKIEQFLENLEKWREEQEYLSLDELIWKIYEDTGFLNYVGLLPNGSLRQANLKMLFERAKQYETASFKGLFNFIRFIEKLKLGSGDMNSAKIIGENEDVVRIMSIHKSKGLEFPIVFLASASTQFNFRDLNDDILLNQELGLGVKYIDYDLQIKYDTLTKLALKEKELNSVLSEEMRILYVALTRAKEKLYITGVSKDFKKEKEKKEELINIYHNFNNKMNPILIKKYRNYLDWIQLVYFSDFSEMNKITDFNVYKKDELMKKFKTDDNAEIEKAKTVLEVAEEEKSRMKKISEELEFDYKYKADIEIPTKTSITAIAHKDKEKINASIITEEEFLKPIDIEEVLDEDFDDENIGKDEIEFPIPKFLAGQEEEKITPAKKGTIVHLCMKNLDFSKDYKLQDIKNMIDELVRKEIITEKEAKAIDSNQILQFTKSDVWEELKQAKEYHKEEPFYINVPANEVEDTESTENILAQGIIDLYYIDKDDKLVLLDYKTDFVKVGEENVLTERHSPQLLLYKEALESALEKKVDRIYIYSTALGKKIKI